MVLKQMIANVFKKKSLPYCKNYYLGFPFLQFFCVCKCIAKLSDKSENSSTLDTWEYIISGKERGSFFMLLAKGVFCLE